MLETIWMNISYNFQVTESVIPVELSSTADLQSTWLIFDLRQQFLVIQDIHDTLEKHFPRAFRLFVIFVKHCHAKKDYLMEL